MGCYITFMASIRFLLVGFVTFVIGMFIMLGLFSSVTNPYMDIVFALLLGLAVAIPLTSKYVYEEQRKMREGYIEHIIVRGRGGRTGMKATDHWWDVR